MAMISFMLIWLGESRIKSCFEFIFLIKNRIHYYIGHVIIHLSLYLFIYSFKTII